MAHKFPGQLAPGPGFELQEMGAAGNGSTEHGDASGEIFWVPMDVFLKYYYQTFPDEMPQPKGEGASATPAAAKKKKHTGADGEPEADEGESKSDIMLVMVGANKKRFAPSVQAIKERYYKKSTIKPSRSVMADVP